MADALAGERLRRRAAEPGRDYERLLALQRESWAINFPGAEFSEDDFGYAFRDAMARGELYVYERGTQLVAWLWLVENTHHTGHIRHVQVATGLWGRGWGRTVVEDAIALAQAAGCQTLTLTVTKSNTRALRLYCSLGFQLLEDQGNRQRMSLSPGSRE